MAKPTKTRELIHYAFITAAVILYFHLNEVHAVHANNILVVGVGLVIIAADKIAHKYILGEK